MRKFIGSVYIKIIALLGGYYAAASLVYALNSPFSRFVYKFIGGLLRISPLLSVLLFLLCTALLAASVWLSPHGRGRGQLDVSVLVVNVLYITLLCLYCGWNLRNDIAPGESRTPIFIRLAILSVLAYGLAAVLFMFTIARLRDRALQRTLYWPQFFRRYPIKRPPGLIMFCLLIGILVYLLILCPWRTFMDGLPLMGAITALLLFNALSYFCAFVLSLFKKFEEANEEALRAERFKAELITNVSHDIRTPLTSIINYVDLLKALPIEDEKFHEYVGVLDKKSARLKTLISDLMEASKASTGNLPVHIKEIELGEILGQIAGEFDDSFVQRKLTLVLRLPEQPVLVQADATHLWRVLENLFGNAAKYALPGTRVFTEISAQDGRIVLSLKNTSENPIDLADQELTEQFIRGDRARQTEGSGLGLYIAKSLMELMGGQLAIEVNGDLFVAAVRFG